MTRSISSGSTTLVVSQISVCLVLLVLTGVLLRRSTAYRQTDPGYKFHHVEYPLFIRRPDGASSSRLGQRLRTEPWIEELASLQITGGCGGNNFCPGNPVTRRQMAAFLLKAKYGSAYVPPPATGIFGDVPSGDPFAPWVERLYSEGVTGGCQAAPLFYCPFNANTRGQMAVFLVKAFGL